VLVTHHVDEIPPGATHALLLKGGRAIAQGPLDEALTSETLSECFGMPLALEHRDDGRFTAWATATPPA
jgi:iron complex transport system ATP-binding protein